jgi:hypothetical protein
MPLFTSDPELSAAGVPDTSPTWELELLISGAVLFGLFQLPGALDSFFSRLEPHTTDATYSALFVVQLYVRAIVYALIASFVVHLVARAYWVGLVGLHSVFPRGVKWEEMRAGPISLEVYRERFSSLPSVIARTDNFCSVIFSFAFLLVILFAFTVFITGVMALTAYVLAQLLFRGRHVRDLFFTFAFVLAVVPALTQVVDRRLGPKLARDSRRARVIRTLARAGHRISLLRVTGPIFLTLLTNFGRRKLTTIFYAAFISVILFVALDRLAQKNVISVNSYDYFGLSASHGVNYRFYENQRDAGAIYARVPSVQADVIRDPYVKLFIPYSPRAHNSLIARDCPNVRPLQERGVQFGPDTLLSDSLAAPVLRCLALIHAVTINGTPRPDLEFSFYEHPQTGIKGIIAYIPTDELPRGRNVITVRPAVAVDAEGRKRAPQPYTIPFWR